MLLDELTAKRGITPHRGRQWIGARDVEKILGVSRAVCCRLAKTGKIQSRLVDRKGERRHYEFQYADVVRLKESGEALKCAPRPTRIRVAWINHFGPIPPGLTVISRDGSHDNIEPRNLALIPLRSALRVSRRIRRRRRKSTRWTLEMRAVLMRDFATRSTDDIAAEFGCSSLAVRQQANRMGLRKSAAYLSARARAARSHPIGTERLMTHDKNEGMILVKVSDTGPHSQQWRPKQHLVWERHNRKNVPKGWRVIFRDGNKENFEPTNLEAIPREVQAAAALARFITAPSPLRKVVRINKALQREIRHQRDGTRGPENKPRGGGRKGRVLRRWSPEMLRTLETGYPTQPFAELAAELGVTVIALKAKAAKLGFRRKLETILADINTRYGVRRHGRSTAKK